MNDDNEKGFLILCMLAMITFITMCMVIMRVDEINKLRIDNQVVTILNKDYIPATNYTRSKPISLGKSVGVRYVNELQPEKYILHVVFDDNTTRDVVTDKIIYDGVKVGFKYKYKDLRR